MPREGQLPSPEEGPLALRQLREIFPAKVIPEWAGQGARSFQAEGPE